MDLKTAREMLMKMQEKASAYGHAMGILSFDGETSAPPKTAENRAHTLGILSEDMYLFSTSKENLDVLEFLDAHSDELTEKEKRMVYLLLKGIRFMQKIPMNEYIEYRQLIVVSGNAWKKAKLENDFASFAPYLEKIFATVKKFAKYVNPDMDPYDFWLNEYEEGLSMEFCEKFFDGIKTRLVPLLQRIAEKPQVDNSCLIGDFDEASQEKFAYYLMDVIGLDKDHVGLSTTEHPFTTSLGSHLDERITTHYYRENVSYSMYSVVHEGGHALYNTGSADDLVYTTLDGGVSMAIHESQSRFYENILGRSKAFTALILPKMKELWPEKFGNVTPEELYRAVNKVMPSFIRTEADEATYALHVLVRYELEKKIFHDEIEVKDIPSEWNRLYKEYLGIDVPDDTRGVLQDTHWGGGLIGYFPSYAIGSAYGAQFIKKMKESVDVDACIERGDFGPINDWNREHIWKFGSSMTPSEVLNVALDGEEFTTDAYMDYLEDKFSEIYGC